MIKIEQVVFQVGAEGGQVRFTQAPQSALKHPSSE